jgi:hypothetical protein
MPDDCPEGAGKSDRHCLADGGGEIIAAPALVDPVGLEFLAELAPRTFCTLPREFSSLTYRAANIIPDYVERQVKPRRADDATRFVRVTLSRLVTRQLLPEEQVLRGGAGLATAT